MNKAKPFTWTVAFTVHPMWVSDGFAIDDARAHEILADALPHADSVELGAVVIEAPRAQDIANVQGYNKGTADYAKRIGGLTADIAQAGVVRSALQKARALLGSVAYVTVGGDTSSVIQQIDQALALIDARQGKTMAVEA